MSFEPVKFYQTGTFTAGNRLLPQEARTVQSGMRRTNSLNSGHRACQGCGEALGARYAIDAAMNATNRQLVAANDTGCLEVFSTPYPETNALFEARRCLSCGNCFECDNCYGVCPDNAVIKLGPGKRFEFNYDYCKGCGLCVSECPCGAIKMVPEEI